MATWNAIQNTGNLETGTAKSLHSFLYNSRRPLHLRGSQFRFHGRYLSAFLSLHLTSKPMDDAMNRTI